MDWFGGSNETARQPDPLHALFIAMAVIGFALAIGLIKLSEHIGPASIPVWLGALGAVAWVARGPLGKAIADRIGGRTEAPPEMPPEVLAELDELRTRVAELEERMDFSERLLARNRERAEQP
ncbi:MAG: hypothetical protein ACOY71_13195 [Gemmatimonadota bacterium]